MDVSALSLLGALCGALAALGLGRLVYPGQPADIRFLLGSAALSWLVFACGILGWLRPSVLIPLGLAAASCCRPSALPRPNRLALLAALPFALAYFIWALAPEHSPDGLAYHWNFPAHYLRAGRIYFEPGSIYAQFPQAIEMLYTFGLAFGNRAPALLHLGFLAALVALMLRWAKPLGPFWHVAFPAAALVFVCPVIAIDAASAYNDVALAAVCFGVFVLGSEYRASRSRPTLLAAAWLAGFAIGIKYTGILAAAWLAGIILLARPSLSTAFAALGVGALPVLPWLLKNAWFTGNPVSPFLNAWFPNPVFDPGLETAWLSSLRWSATGIHWLAIPWETCLRGDALRGLLGPAFLLLPLGLLALRTPEGRRLAVAAVLFSLPFAFNAGTRFLVPALPFWALLIVLSLRRLPAAALVLCAIQALAAWPPLLDHWVAPHAWRIRDLPWQAALGWESERDYLIRRHPETALLPALSSGDGIVLAFGPFAEAYSPARLWIANHSRPAAEAAHVVAAAGAPAQRPTTRLRFWFPARPTTAVRLVQTKGPPLRLAEFRVYHLLQALRTRGSHGFPNPFDTSRACDGNRFSRWISGHESGSGVTFQVDLPPATAVSRVEADLETGADLPEIHIEILVGGVWRQAASHFEVIKGTEENAGFDMEALSALSSLGIRYILVQNGDPLPRDPPPGIPLRLSAQTASARLYHLVGRSPTHQSP